jgi:amphiphysin
MEFLPLVTEIAIQVQFTLVQHSYSALYHYANDNGFTDGDIEVIKSEWDDLFMPVKHQVETELKIIAKGKAVSLPMNHIYDNSRLAKLPSMPSMPLGRGKKPPPPPPPAGAMNGLSSPPRGREGSITSPKSSTSLHSRYSRAEDVSPAPPVPGARPTIGRARASTTSTRDESPPPPLPGPRPGNDTPEKPRMASYGSSYGGGGVTPTPLAGLKPSQLKAANNANNVAAANASLAAITNPSAGRIGGALSPPAYAVATRSVSDGGFAAAAAAKKKPPPPPPKKKFAGANETWVKALFTFAGQDSGDLSFNEGDRIKVTKKTPSTDGKFKVIFQVTRTLLIVDLDWWEGEVHGRKGSFPANYCEPA